MTYKLFLHREECQSNTEQSWIVKNEQSKFFPSESLSLFQCFIENVWCLSGPRKCWVLHMWGRAVRADLIRIPLYWSLLAQLIETRGRKNISGVRPSWRSHSWHTQCRILASSFMNTACANSGGWHFSPSWPPSSGCCVQAVRWKLIWFSLSAHSAESCLVQGALCRISSYGWGINALWSDTVTCAGAVLWMGRWAGKKNLLNPKF